MVDGYEKVGMRCAVVDVDGTVIRGNSMREMVLFILRRAAAEGDLRLVAEMLRWVALRVLRVISHKEMKHPIHLLAAGYMADKGRIGRFVSRLMAKTHPGVLNLISELKGGGVKILLATAAPDVYMDGLAAALGADGYTATHSASELDGYCENRGVEKLARVETYVADRGWQIACVVTDHEDDLPLLLLDGVRRVLVRPDDALCRRLDAAHLGYEVIR